MSSFLNNISNFLIISELLEKFTSVFCCQNVYNLFDTAIGLRPVAD